MNDYLKFDRQEYLDFAEDFENNLVIDPTKEMDELEHNIYLLADALAYTRYALAKLEAREKYQKNEFCKAVDCRCLNEYGCNLNEHQNKFCHFTTKQFHKWLDNNGFEIVKKGDG